MMNNQNKSSPNQPLWESIADEYDARMNDDGNDFHQRQAR